MKNAFQYSHRTVGVIYTDSRGSGRGLSRGVRLMSYSAVPYYLKLIRSMGVGPCEWSEVKTNAATKEGFLMNTLRRISRPLVKTFAVGAVMVAAALPAMALSGTASAATTAPTLVCTVASSALTPTCTTGYAIIGQGFGGQFYALGTGFANDQAVGGNVTLTTTAPGVTFSNVNETGASTLTATITSTSATTPGFYPVTLTDDNGTVTFAVGLGVDNGPQITTIAGNAGTNGGSASTVTVTGTFLNGATPTLTGTGTIPVVSSVVSNNAGTSLTFNVNNVGTPGSFGISVTAPWPAPALGVATSSYTLNGAATPVSITSVSPNELGIPLVNPSSQTVTISGTGFELGAVLTITSYTGVTVSNPTFVNSTTMTELVTIAPGTAIGELNVAIVNPDTSTVSGAGLIGIGEPATNTVAGPAAPVAPAIESLVGFLTPGTSSILHVKGTTTFPITTGSTVNVHQTGITNVSESLSGTVVSVDSTNTATIRVQVPRFATTVTSAAALAGATTLPVVDASGLVTFPATVTIIDGTSTENVVASAGTATSLTISATRYAHVTGVTIEFPFPAHVDTLSINDGTNTETASVTVNAPPPELNTATSTGATLGTLDPGTYSINAYVPGFGFGTGSAVTFQSFNAGVLDNDGVTGTVTVVNGNTATLAVTVPKVRSSATGDYLTTSASAGQNALQLNSVVNSALTPAGNIAVGDSLTINADAFYTTPETVTVTAVNTTTNVVSITPALADPHTGGGVGVGATITDNSDPQSLTDTVQMNLTNGSGGVDLVNPFFTFTTAGTITHSSLNPVGAGANKAAETFTLSQATPDVLPLTDWTASSTTAGVTFGASTANTGGTISFPISVAPGTPAAASVPVSLTDGLETYSGTIAIVAGPTISAVTAVGNLTASSLGFTVGVTGTNFVVGNGTTPNMSCSTSDPAVTCTVDETVTDTTTTATVSVFPGAAMLNGTFSLTLTDSGAVGAPVTLNVPTDGAGTLAGAFTVTGQPVVTTIAPTVIPAGSAAMPSVATPLVITGTGFSTAPTTCTLVATHPDLSTTSGTCTLAAGGTATTAGITAFTYAGYGIGSGGDSIVFTFGTTTATAATPAVLVQTDPINSFLISSSIWTNFTSLTTISIGSTAVPFHIVGSGYLASATVTLSQGTATVTQVTPNAIFGTITIPSTATVGTDTVTVTNTNGGSDISAAFFNIAAAPSITAPSVGTPKPILDGVATTITITGTGFAAGAVVTGAVAGVDTFGAATVSASANALDKCTGLAGDFCNTIKVLVTPVSYSGSTPILDGLVVTNPVGGGSVTVQSDLTINPVPAVTGTYYVPTFTTNAEITINGTGFETGITASSANPDYTVLAVASTPTTVTLLVTTDSNATSGTSSTITLTNPDTGSGTFPLNGGPNPNTVTPAPKATHVNGVVHTGKKSKVTISGTHFYGQPKITSNAKGTKVQVSGDNGKLLTVWVTTTKTTPKGVHTFIIRFANGGQTSVKYNQGK